MHIFSSKKSCSSPKLTELLRLWQHHLKVKRSKIVDILLLYEQLWHDRNKTIADLLKRTEQYTDHSNPDQMLLTWEVVELESPACLAWESATAANDAGNWDSIVILEMMTSSSLNLDNVDVGVSLNWALSDCTKDETSLTASTAFLSVWRDVLTSASFFSVLCVTASHALSTYSNLTSPCSLLALNASCPSYRCLITMLGLALKANIFGLALDLGLEAQVLGFGLAARGLGFELET